MRYVDGFALPVPKKNLPAYRSLAQKAGKVWREHGALQYIEAVGDDTALAGIQRLVAEAQQSRSRAQVLADRAAGHNESRQHGNAGQSNTETGRALHSDLLPFGLSGACTQPITAADPLELAPRLAQHVRGDEIVVLKASRGVALERILPALKARAKHVGPPGAPLHPR